MGFWGSGVAELLDRQWQLAEFNGGSIRLFFMNLPPWNLHESPWLGYIRGWHYTLLTLIALVSKKSGSIILVVNNTVGVGGKRLGVVFQLKRDPPAWFWIGKHELLFLFHFY